MNYDIDTKDWAGDYNYARNVYTSILSQHNPASSSWISLEHDIKEQTVYSLTQYLIDQARTLGYRLVTLGECLGDPAANWYRDPRTGEPYDASRPSGQTTSSSAVAASLPLSSSGVLVATPTPVPNVIFGAGTSPKDRTRAYSQGTFPTSAADELSPGPTSANLDAPPRSSAVRVSGSFWSCVAGLLSCWWLL
jgi:hypothetical protein